MSGSRTKLAGLYRQMATVCMSIADEMDGNGKSAAGATYTQGADVASDRDLDGDYGDVEIRKDPKRWDGASMVGKRMSQCPPEYLDTLAGFLDWKAGKNEEDASGPDGEKKLKYASYDRRDAARARGWAARLRNGWAAKASPQEEAAAGDASPFDGIDDSSIPF